MGAVVKGVDVDVVVDSALLMILSRDCLLNGLPVVKELINFVLVPDGDDESNRLVWYRSLDPVLVPMVWIRAVY